MNKENTRGKVLKGYVLSDLHLFAGRSEGDSYKNKVLESASRADFLVLCGDIFDFKWTTYATTNESIDASIEWLCLLCKLTPECSIIYLMGNHDGIAPFKPLLNSLADTTENFSWHPAYFQIGDVLFLHGDIPVESRGVELTERKLTIPKKSKGSVMNFIYQAFTNLGGLKLYRCLHDKKRVIKLIDNAIADYETKSDSTIKRVYFGHSHVPFSGIEYNRRTFYNTGSAIKNQPFKMMYVTIKIDE